jgi:Acetyltransferase (GNAT) domain
MSIYVINPLSDDRWIDLVDRHPSASVFHHRGFLQALLYTYGYEPFALTCTPPGQPLKDGIVLCRVSSWVTGRRLVSLPFADHCEPLLDNTSETMALVEYLAGEYKRQHCKYVELRPLSLHNRFRAQLSDAHSYLFHLLDISPGLEHIFRGFHKTSVQQRIRRAEKEGLSYECGCSERLVEEFYGLLLKTRRRHQMFPQPRAWFKNLLTCLGSRVEIRVARKDGVAVAAIFTLRHRQSVVYKYGCSDEKLHKLGGIPFLLWKLIEESKISGAERLDFGRSDLDNEGLVSFKDRFGAIKTSLTYIRYPRCKEEMAGSSWGVRAVRRIFGVMPDAISPIAGRFLYRHIG